MVDEFRRLENHRLVTVTQRYLSALRDQQLRRVCEGGCREFTLALLNVRSLSAHALDVAKDPVLSRVDLFCLTETWNRSSGDCAADVALSGYDRVTRALAERRAGGVDVFLKRYRPFSEELRRQQDRTQLLVLQRADLAPDASPRTCPTDDPCSFARSGSRGEYCGVCLVGHVYANVLSHAVCTSPLRDESPYAFVYTSAYSGDAVLVVTVYLAPNLSRDAVLEQMDAAMESVSVRARPSVPVVVVGDFNVDVRKDNGWLVDHMLNNYSMTCLSLEFPTTINGGFIDLAFSRNCTVRAVLPDPLTVHFSDHKALVLTVSYNDNTNRC